MPNHATKTDGVWRVMRFETEHGKYAEVASNEVGPEGIPVPPGYRFVSAIEMVALRDVVDELRAWHGCDERVVSYLLQQFGGGS